MKKSLSFFSLIAMLLFTSSCTKEDLPIRSNKTDSMSYQSYSPFNLYAHLTKPADKSTYIPVDNFDPYEDAFAEQTLERQESGFQELTIDNIYFESIGLDLFGKAKDLLESCQFVAYIPGSTTPAYLLATYNPEESNSSDNFQIEISAEDFTTLVKENRSLVYYFRFEYKEEPPLQNYSFLEVRYYMRMNYDYTLLPNVEK